MLGGALVLMVSSVVANPPGDMNYGIIDGIVTNGTRDHEPMSGIDVALRVRVDGQFVGLERTTSAPDGTYRFDRLPVDAEILYLPGASQDDVHFPGPRVRLSPQRHHESITLAVYDSISDRNPLRMKSQKIVVDAQPGVLQVTESILIDNPSRYCYVGRAIHQDKAPVTLQLAIPPDFERVTFDEEALGRRFRVINDRLVTGIPWPPGVREVNFSYVIASEKSHRVWERALDLPSSEVELTVRVNDPGSVACNLPQKGTVQKGQVSFALNQEIPAGHLLRLELGRLGMPTMVYARRAALLILAVLIVGVSVTSVRRHRSAAEELPPG